MFSQEHNNMNQKANTTEYILSLVLAFQELTYLIVKTDLKMSAIKPKIYFIMLAFTITLKIICCFNILLQTHDMLRYRTNRQ